MCSKSGIVVGSIMMASFDFFSSSSRVRNTVADAYAPPATAFVKTALQASGDAAPESQLFEEIYGECFRVVSRLLRENGDLDTAWRDTVVKRCVRTCTMCSIMEKKKVKSANTKSEYTCLAVLYLIREGLVVRGTVVCERDARLADALPSLNALTLFGFKKGKFTRASRFLLQAVDRVLLTKPLHKVRV